MYTPIRPQFFFYRKVGLKGVKIKLACFSEGKVFFRSVANYIHISEVVITQLLIFDPMWENKEQFSNLRAMKTNSWLTSWAVALIILCDVNPLLPIKYGPHQAKNAQNVRKHTILHMRRFSSGHLLSIETFFSLQCSIFGQQRPWSDCADAQADLGLRCPHMPEYTFSHDEAHIVKHGMQGLMPLVILMHFFSIYLLYIYASSWS